MTSELFHPTQEHILLRQTVRDFVKKHVEPQALEHDQHERFNLSFFCQLDELGLLGITVPEERWGSRHGCSRCCDCP